MGDSPRDLNDDDLGQVSGGVGATVGSIAFGAKAGDAGVPDVEQMFVTALAQHGLIPADAAGKPLAEVSRMASDGAFGMTAQFAAMIAAAQQAGAQIGQARLKVDAADKLAAMLDAALKVQDQPYPAADGAGPPTIERA